MSADDLLNRGIHLYHDGHLAESARLLRAGAADARRTHDLSAEMLSLSNLAEAYTLSGRLEEAEHVAVQLLQRAREKKQTPYEVRAVGRLAIAILQRDLRGQWGELRPQLEKSVQLARRLRLDYWIAQNLETLGACAQHSGDLGHAFEWFQQALAPLSDQVTEEEFFRARIYARIGELYSERSRADKSREFLALAEEYSETAGSPNLKSQIELARGRCALRAGDLDTALGCTHGAYLAARRGGWRGDEHAAASALTEVYLKRGQRGEAEAPARRALELAREMRMTEAEVQALINLARADRGGAGARGYLEEALDRARENSYDDHVVTVNLELARLR